MKKIALSIRWLWSISKFNKFGDLIIINYNGSENDFTIYLLVYFISLQKRWNDDYMTGVTI